VRCLNVFSRQNAVSHLYIVLNIFKEAFTGRVIEIDHIHEFNVYVLISLYYLADEIVVISNGIKAKKKNRKKKKSSTGNMKMTGNADKKNNSKVEKRRKANEEDKVLRTEPTTFRQRLFNLFCCCFKN
jgi:cellulose synthase/poly-beta-1,6-N-acetylglucosamine synthase-like glycosyltransferase